MPKISVIVPVYGVEKYIERCARSLFEQTLDDIEYIFVDDCTPDKSIEILEKVLDDYPDRKRQVKIVRLEKNGGLPQARKAGIQQATGDYLIHCDSDDWVDVTMYEKLYRKAVETGADMVWCDFYISDGSNNICSTLNKFSDNKELLMKHLISGQTHSSLVIKLVRTTIYANEICYPQKNMREDLALMVQLLYFAKKIEKVEEPLYYYYSNQSSMSKDIDYNSVVKRYSDSIENFNIIYSFLANHGVSDIYDKELLVLKFRIKENLAIITNSDDGEKLWKESFPEIRIIDVIKMNVNYIIKIKYFLTELGIYPYIKRMMK